MDIFLNQLAGKLGITNSFSDSGINHREYHVDDEVVKFFCKQLGYDAGNVQEIAKSLDDFDKRRWQRTLESIYIVKGKDIRFDAVVPYDRRNAEFDMWLSKKGGGKTIRVPFEVVRTPYERFVGKTSYVKLDVLIHAALDIGYYEITFSFDRKTFKSTLAVVPEKCYEPETLKENKAWGFAVQLYSLRSFRNWGVGDFTDLCELVRIASRAGADVIGLNPLNVLQHNYPEEASPYFSTSRLFLNPIYIDVENVPEFKPSDIKGRHGEIENLRANDLIKYTEVYNLKMEIMETLYERFLKSGTESRKKAFDKFCEEKGDELSKLAVFQSIHDDKHDKVKGGWRAWEEDYRNPYSVKVKDYEKKNERKVNFFKFLQFETDRQFGLAGDLVRKSGLRIGFYQDLAVGVGKDSVELWSDPDLFIKGAGAGAPPDAFFPLGQKWGLGAFNPFMLKEKAYRPFIEILRTAMKHAGALRIDHVMSLMRLYVIPDNREQGTYIHYNFEDMLDIVALESCLNQCAVVGESIGNVPDGFIAKITEKNIRALSILWAERWDVGRGMFKAPKDYPADAFVSVGTHDMAPLRMWWFGYDISLVRSLGLIDNDAQMNNEYSRREKDRWLLLTALDEERVWPEDNRRKNNDIYGEAYPEGIEEAVHRYIAKSPSIVFLAELENILHVERLQNLPGMDRDIYPNWRHKLPVELERLESDIAYLRNIAAIKRER